MTLHHYPTITHPNGPSNQALYLEAGLARVCEIGVFVALMVFLCLIRLIPTSAPLAVEVSILSQPSTEWIAR